MGERKTAVPRRATNEIQLHSQHLRSVYTRFPLFFLFFFDSVKNWSPSIPVRNASVPSRHSRIVSLAHTIPAFVRSPFRFSCLFSAFIWLIFALFVDSRSLIQLLHGRNIGSGLETRAIRAEIDIQSLIETAIPLIRSTCCSWPKLSAVRFCSPFSSSFAI